jgi:gas vesicle protein
MREGFFAFLGGVVVGAVTALLVAPKSGKETREELKKYIEDAEKILRDKSENLIEEGKKQLEKIKDKAQNMLEEGKEAVVKASEKQSKSTHKS